MGNMVLQNDELEGIRNYRQLTARKKKEFYKAMKILLRMEVKADGKRKYHLLRGSAKI